MTDPSNRTSSSRQSYSDVHSGRFLGWLFPKRKQSVTEQRLAGILKRRPTLEENAWDNGWGPEAPLPNGIGGPPPKGADVVREPEQELPIRRKLFTTAEDSTKPYDC